MPRGLLGGKRPDITPAQVAALITFVIGQAVAFGVIDNANGKVALSATSAVVAIAWKIADALIRNGRNLGGSDTSLAPAVLLPPPSTPDGQAARPETSAATS